MLRRFESIQGSALAAADGEIGKVRGIYFDDHRWLVRYLVVETGSWLFGRWVLIAPESLGAVDTQGHTIAVRLTKEQVKNAPEFDSEKPVSLQHEEALQRHYGWNPYWAVPGGISVPWPVMPATAETAAEPAEREPAQGDPHLRSSREVAGYKLHAQDREVAGEIVDFVVDDDGWHMRYLVADTGSWLRGREVLLATEWVDEISYSGREVFVSLPRSIIKEAPAYDKAATIDRAYEHRLHEHYQRKGYWDAVGAARGS